MSQKKEILSHVFFRKYIPRIGAKRNMSPNEGGGGGVANEYSCAHGAQINSIFSLQGRGSQLHSEQCTSLLTLESRFFKHYFQLK